MAAAALALLVAGLVLNAAMFMIDRGRLEAAAAAQARVIAPNVQAALLFGDPQSAQETLDAMRGAPSIARATLIDTKGAIVADFRRDHTTSDATRLTVGPDAQPGVSQEDGRLLVLEPVMSANAVAGWLRLEVPLQPLYSTAGMFGAVTVSTAALAMLLVWLLATGARRDVERIERRLDDLAYHDPVTGLFNRHAAAEHLEAYAQARPPRQCFIVTVDLDDFKHINDSLGHDVGDEVLRVVARRLTDGLPPAARVYRFGGDEFVVVCDCDHALSDPEPFGQSVRQLVGHSIRLDGLEVAMSGSFGVARFPQDGERPEDVLRASDMAMYDAKSRGKNAVSVFGAALREASQARLHVESDLRQALRNGQLRLQFQPLVDLATGRIVGAEALVRWQHPTRGLLLPGAFIDVAEASGLIVPIGGWVLMEATRQLQQWHALGLQTVRLAVNVSARQLRGGRLQDQFAQARAACGVDPGQLGLEIELTEHTLVEDLEDNLALLEGLRRAGVHIAIDDFGTGLSSLSYLKRLPIDKLKIDRSFVAGLPHDAGDRAIVSAALSMAHALGLTVVAEGVETEAQRDTLLAMGCDLGQGWVFGRPMSGGELTTRLQFSAGTVAA